MCFFTVESISYKFKFMCQLNNSFGSGGMSLAMSEAQFSMFIQYLKNSISKLPIVNAVTHVGEQSDGVWVFNKTTQINSSGEVTTTEFGEAGEILVQENQEYIWLEEAFSDRNSISVDQLIPTITLPTDSGILHRYETILK